MPAATQFQIVVSIVGSLAGALCALAFIRKVRLERPPIGTFNAGDMGVLAFFIVTLPVLYLEVPAGVLTAFLVITFFSALLIALRPLASARLLWVAIPVVLIANIVVTGAMDSMRGGLQIYWLLTSAVVLVAGVGVANVYVQGGLTLRHIAWFTLFLGVYDITFTRVFPLTPLLAVALQGRPLDPSVGFAAGGYNANVGLTRSASHMTSPPSPAPASTRPSSPRARRIPGGRALRAPSAMSAPCIRAWAARSR